MGAFKSDDSLILTLTRSITQQLTLSLSNIKLQPHKTSKHKPTAAAASASTKASYSPLRSAQLATLLGRILVRSRLDLRPRFAHEVENLPARSLRRLPNEPFFERPQNEWLALGCRHRGVLIAKQLQNQPVAPGSRDVHFGRQTAHAANQCLRHAGDWPTRFRFGQHAMERSGLVEEIQGYDLIILKPNMHQTA
jgi:hypothetical protein